MNKHQRGLLKKIRAQEKAKYGYTPYAALFGKAAKKQKTRQLL